MRACDAWLLFTLMLFLRLLVGDLTCLQCTTGLRDEPGRRHAPAGLQGAG